MDVSGRILVVDVGSSSLKAVVIAPDGRLVAQAEAEYPTHVAGPGRHEQDPRDWWDAARRAVGALAGREAVGAVALAGTMQNVALLDRAGAPVAPALLYSDSRAAEIFAATAPRLVAAGYEGVIGNRFDPLMPLFKLLWLREHARDAFERAEIVVSGAKDYLALMMTGVLATDPTAATTTGLMDLRERDWSAPLVEAAGWADRALPRILPADEPLGGLLPGPAAELGLRAGIPVFNGCGDAGASTVGAGATMGGPAYVYLGTSAWVARVEPFGDAPFPRRNYVLAHPSEDAIVDVGAMLTGGDCLAWAQETLGAGEPIDALLARAEAHDAAPPDVMFLPYLKGERAPFADTQVRAGFLGIDRGDDRDALIYAVVEGLALALGTLVAAGDAPRRGLLLTGGGARSALLARLVADATGEAVSVASVPTAVTAYGAFRLAARALGSEPEPLAVEGVFEPRPERRARAAHRAALFASATAHARDWAASKASGG